MEASKRIISLDGAPNIYGATLQGNWPEAQPPLAADMYRATLEGNWSDAELLLAANPNLAHGQITRGGDRALHVAVAMGHKEFVENLVQRMSEDYIGTLLDGRGYTACCYAAVSGAEEIAHILMEKNPSVVTSKDAKKVTLLHKSALFGKKNMVQYFLNLTKLENLSRQEWFDLLLTVIHKKMFDVALKIVEMNGSLAHMRNDEGTALHVLARLDVALELEEGEGDLYLALMRNREELTGARTLAPLDDWTWRPKSVIEYSKTQQDIRLLTERLWAEVQELKQDEAIIELMINPPILHEAAKTGNVELLTMFTQSYPDLIWHTDNKGYSIFHIAVIHGRQNVFTLSDQIGTVKNLVEISQDDDGNNILHLAAKLSSVTARHGVVSPVLELRQKLKWFRLVRANVTPLCLNMRNKEGVTPGELFSEQHACLLEKSEAWTRRTAESCMIIATIFLTMVFTALFTVPGGNNQDTGFPTLLKKRSFQAFLGYEFSAFLFSSMTIIIFWSILTSSFEEDMFINVLPIQLIVGLGLLLLSFISTFLVFTSAFFLVIEKSKGSKAAKIGTIVLSLEMLAIICHISSIGVRRIPRRLDFSDVLPRSRLFSSTIS